MTGPAPVAAARLRQLQALGVLSGFAAGAWLGAAEAPAKLVTAGFSPFIVSFGMVAGVFVARWTVPTLLAQPECTWFPLQASGFCLTRFFGPKIITIRMTASSSSP